MMQSVTLLRWLLLGTFLSAGLGAGCGGGDVVLGDSAILASLGTLPARATQVVVSSMLDNKTAMNTQLLTPPTNIFAVELPSTQSGHLVLDAVAYDSDSCLQASSMGAIDLPSGRTELAMPLMARSPRKCGSLDPCAASTVCAATKPVVSTIQSVWIVSPKDIWAVGLAATLLHFDGTSWTLIPPPAGVTENLFGVWGNATNNLWAVGSGGRIIYYNGTAWSAVSSGTTLTLYGVWGVSNTEVWAAGNSTSTTTQGIFLHYNGSQWTPIVDTGLGTGQLNSVWADSTKFIYACGIKGLLARYNGTQWTSLTSTITDNLHSIWGTAGGIDAATVFATGDNGHIFRLRYKLDMEWQPVPVSGTTSFLYGIHGDNVNKVVYAVGQNGTIVKSVDPYDTFVAQKSSTQTTLFGVDLGSNGLLWTGGGVPAMSNTGYLGYLDQRP